MGVTLKSGALVAAIFLWGAVSIACSRPSLLYEGLGDLTVEPIAARLVRITEGGLVPSGPILIEKGQAGIAFLNELRDRPVSILIPKGGAGGAKCSYSGGFTTDDVAAFTADPLPPGGVASICVHEAGTIAFEVHGAAAKPLRGVFEVIPMREEKGAP